MSTLERCTLTGADDGIEPDDLFELSSRFSWAEWGILFHKTHQGSGRYPSFDWIDALCRQMRDHPSAHFALHICGQDAIHEYMQGSGLVAKVATNFPRIQLNLAAGKTDLALLMAAIARHPDKIIITQHNKVNSNLWHELSSLPNHAVLFDESGGMCISPSDWPEPLPGKRYGYAGGLGPSNLETELDRIALASKDHPFWIDMEGKLRNEADQFDLSLVERCLASCSRFVAKQ